LPTDGSPRPVRRVTREHAAPASSLALVNAFSLGCERVRPLAWYPLMLWAISGGAGFLGLHLARRLLADGHDVRTLDVVPLDDAELERSVDALRGDVRDLERVRALVAGAEVIVHAAAALPIQASRASIRSVNMAGTANVLEAGRDAGARRVLFISSTAVYGVPEKHPIDEDDPLVGVGWYGESKIDAEALCRVAAVETTILRPKTFIGPERLGVFEILFDWIRDGRRIYILGKGHNRYQLLAVEDLVEAIVRAATVPDAAGETFNVGATEFGTVRTDLQALIDHAGSTSRLQPLPPKPAELALRALELLEVSPLAEWHYRTAHKDSFVDVSRAQRVLGWQPRLCNREALIATYDWYLANRERVGDAGVTHRVPWNQQALGLLKRLS
jgi:nucleoside-diphosphate-sugar epimerase